MFYSVNEKPFRKLNLKSYHDTSLITDGIGEGRWHETSNPYMSEIDRQADRQTDGFQVVLYFLGLQMWK